MSTPTLVLDLSIFESIRPPWLQEPLCLLWLGIEQDYPTRMCPLNLQGSYFTHIRSFFFIFLFFFSCCSNELFRLFCASIHQPKHPQDDLRLLQCQHWFLIRCLAIPLNSSLFTRLHRRIPHLHCRPAISPRFCSVCVCSSARGKQNKKKQEQRPERLLLSARRGLFTFRFSLRAIWPLQVRFQVYKTPTCHLNWLL